MSRTDAELIAACRAGDVESFDELYQRHRDWVAAVGFRMCAHREDTLDVLQDTFAYLVRKLPELTLSGRLSTFLYPVVKHLARDRRRRRGREQELTAADEPSVLPGLPTDVRDWFVDLGPLQQEILALRFADELELAEIAEILDVPLGTVKSRLHNAIATLRKKHDAE